jgi:hypothetical protein
MLIGLNGKKQAGKDTVYARIRHLLGAGSLTGATVERASFADKLYESAAEALGSTVATLQNVKSDPRWTVAILAPNGRPVSEQTVRQYLQRYGTEAHRDVFGANFWVDAVDLSHDRKIVVVTDVRFENEAQAVADAGGVVVRVVGPPDVEEAGDGHASEAPLPHALIDATLDNSVRNDGFRALDEQVLALVLRLLKERQ